MSSNKTSHTLPKVIPPLPRNEKGAFTRPLKVCFSVPEFLGFPIRGGIGQDYAAFAVSLVKAGHDVTVLMAADYAPDDPRMSGVEEGAKALGVHLVFLPELPFRCAKAQNRGQHPIIAYRAWHWLKDKIFDVIHFTEYLTSGFFCVSAKRGGMGFQNTLLSVSLRGPSRWCREGDAVFISEFAMLETDFLEQKTSELADLVIVPSRHIAEWVASNGWDLPAHIYHQANLMLIPESITPRKVSASETLKDIVFFGRLQPRKGLQEFCEAIDLLDPALLSDVSITFLGSHVTAPIDSKSYLANKTASWGAARVNVLDHCSREESLNYLRRPGGLAVIPSRLESCGNALQECLVLGIPFLAANTAVIPELIRPADQGAVLFELSAKALAKKLAAALIEPLQAVPPLQNAEESEDRWVGWHNEIATHRPDFLWKAPTDALPRVSVCMTHFNQPILVLDAIKSLEAQTYTNFEVILVDDGSTHPAAKAVLAEIEQRFAVRGWRVLRQENLYIGAARNHAAREAEGEFLIFMDDDNIAKPDEIACFVRAALTSGQDVVVSMMDCFEGLGDPLPVGHPGHWRELFLGGPLSAALFENTLGDANLFVRREVYQKLGGFSEMKQITGEDRHFLAKAALAGHCIQLLPEALYHYRVRSNSVYRSLNIVGQGKLAVSVFDDVIPPPLKDTLVYAFCLHTNQSSSSGKPATLRDYRTVADSSVTTIGVQVYWGMGWFEDEADQIWSGGEALSATLLLNAASSCDINFCAHVVAAEHGNFLSVALNGEEFENRVEGQILRIADLPLRQGMNILSFTPKLPPARVIPGDHRKLGYLFTQISITPSSSEEPVPISIDVMPPAASPDRTVLINELFKVGARAGFDEGWYDDEIAHRWCGQSGQTSSIIFQSPVEQRIRLAAGIKWLSEGDSLQTQCHGETAHFEHPGEQLDLELTIKPDIVNTLVFETALPPVSPGSDDSRHLSFRLSNIQITLI